MSEPTSFVCRAASVVTRLYSDLSPTDDGVLWHDHSTDGGDIVCTGPFTLFADDRTWRSARGVLNGPKVICFCGAEHIAGWCLTEKEPTTTLKNEWMARAVQAETVLRELYDATELDADAGPAGEGWRSDERLALQARAREVLHIRTSSPV